MLVGSKAPAAANTHGVYFHSPLCGTCKVAKRMIKVMEETFPHFEIREVNINEEMALAHSLKVTSIPCLIIFQEEREAERLYAFRSLEHLYTKLKPYTVVERLHKSFRLDQTKGD